MKCSVLVKPETVLVNQISVSVFSGEVHLNGVLHDSIEAKHRLVELMDLCVDLDSVSATKSIPNAGGIPAHSAPPVGWLEATN